MYENTIKQTISKSLRGYCFHANEIQKTVHCAFVYFSDARKVQKLNMYSLSYFQLGVLVSFKKYTKFTQTQVV